MDGQHNQLPPYDLVDLRLFVKVVQAKSFTRGAQSCLLSIPAASLRIKNLEELIGTKLLIRTARGVFPTDAGVVFLRHARTLLDQIERLQTDLQPFSRGVRGHVRLFANTGAASGSLPNTLAKFLATHRAVTVDLQLWSSGEVVRAVNEGIADAGIISGTVHADGLETLPFGRDCLVLAVPLDHDHPLGNTPAVRFADVLEHDFVGLDRHNAIHTFLQNAVAQLGRSMRVRIEMSNFDAMCRMVEANVGIGVLPQKTARRLAKTLRIRTVELLDPWARFELRICVRRLDDLPTFARELIEFMVHDTEAADDQSA